jgi:hypothetical protein
VVLTVAWTIDGYTKLLFKHLSSTSKLKESITQENFSLALDPFDVFADSSNLTEPASQFTPEQFWYATVFSALMFGQSTLRFLSYHHSQRSQAKQEGRQRSLGKPILSHVSSLCR